MKNEKIEKIEKINIMEGGRQVISRSSLRLALPVGIERFLHDCIIESGLQQAVFFNKVYNDFIRKVAPNERFGSIRNAILKGVQYLPGAPTTEVESDRIRLDYKFINISTELYNTLTTYAVLYKVNRYDLFSYMIIVWIGKYRFLEYVNYRCKNVTIENLLGNRYADWLKDQKNMIKQYFEEFRLRGRLMDDDSVECYCNILSLQSPGYTKASVEECLETIAAIENVNCNFVASTFRKVKVVLLRGTYKRLAHICIERNIPIADLVSIVLYETDGNGKCKRAFKDDCIYYYEPVNGVLECREVNTHAK